MELSFDYIHKFFRKFREYYILCVSTMWISMYIICH